MNRRHITLAAVLACCVIAAGCGSKSSGLGSTSSANSTARAKALALAGRTVHVTMQKLRFHPPHVTVKVGSTVLWTNSDSVKHNVTAVSGAKFKSNDFGSGSSFTFTVTKPGTIHYICTIHPGMVGTITVTS
jgi:plastocyanin